MMAATQGIMLDTAELNNTGKSSQIFNPAQQRQN